MRAALSTGELIVACEKTFTCQTIKPRTGKVAFSRQPRLVGLCWYTHWTHESGFISFYRNPGLSFSGIDPLPCFNRCPFTPVGQAELRELTGASNRKLHEDEALIEEQQFMDNFTKAELRESQALCSSIRLKLRYYGDEVARLR